MGPPVSSLSNGSAAGSWGGSAAIPVRQIDRTRAATDAKAITRWANSSRRTAPAVMIRAVVHFRRLTFSQIGIQIHFGPIASHIIVSRFVKFVTVSQCEVILP